MPERKKDNFPESGFKWIVFVIFMGGAFFYSEGNSFYPEAVNILRLVGTLLLLFGLMFLVVLLFAGGIVWFERWDFKRKIATLSDSVESSEKLIMRKKPPYLLIDSLGREILVVLSQVGGALLTSLEIMKSEIRVRNKNEFISSVSRLVTLGLVYEPAGFPYFRIYLTPRGIDAINLPPSLFVSNIPEGVWKLMLKGKIAFSEGRWSESAIMYANALSSDMTSLIEAEKYSQNTKWSELIESNGDVRKADASNKWQLGIQLKTLRLLNIIRENSLEDKLLSDFISLRNRVHLKPDDKGQAFGEKEISRMDMCIDFIMHIWHGP